MTLVHPVNVSTAMSLVLVFLLFLYSLRRPRKEALPPGPRRWPLVGNLFQLPRVKPWLTYREWAKTYGKIYVALSPLSSHDLP